MFKKHGLLITYSLVFLFSLFIVFFVGIKVDQDSGNENFTLSFDGVTQFKKGLDISGGVRLTYKIDFSQYEKTYDNQARLNDIKNNVENIILKTIDQRISTLGVSDYNAKITKMGDNKYVVVEIGGVKDVEEAKELIGKTVQLEFKLPYKQVDRNDKKIKQQRRKLAESILEKVVKSGTNINDLSNPEKKITYKEIIGKKEKKLPKYIYKNIENLKELKNQDVYNTLIENDSDNSRKIIKKIGGGDKSEKYSFGVLSINYFPKWVVAKDPVSGDILNAQFFDYATVSTSQSGQPVVVINFNSKGGQVYCNITKKYVGEQMAIFVGGELKTAPVIREPLCGGSSQISGNFSNKEAKKLSDELNEGAMPAPLILSQEEQVSATLGEKALQAALISGGVGFFLIFLFLISFYGIKMGITGFISLIVFLSILFAFVKLIGYSLSLSGIAAIILSIGIAVDANVLIFERIREELKSGKSIINAINDGYDRSFSAIRDGNLTTGLIALLLFLIGANVFRGFGTMMLLNIILILAVVLILTKYVLLFLYEEKIFESESDSKYIEV